MKSFLFFFLLICALALPARAQVTATATTGQTLTLTASWTGGTSNGVPNCTTFWYKGDTTGIAIASANPFVKANLQPSDSGVYVCVISNSAGSVTTPPVTLTVTAPPPVVVAPANPQATASFK
jgi:hypothetical protein